MPDEEPSPGVFGLLRNIISIAGTSDRKYIVQAQCFGIRRIFGIMQKR